jgi:hypothetical protein
MDMQELIRLYKETKSEIENLEEYLNSLRSSILQECDNQPYQGHGLTVSEVVPEPTLDWKTAVKALEIDQARLLPFFKERAKYFKFTIKRTIEV